MTDKELEFKIIFIGTWAFKINDWLWSRANHSDDIVKQESSELKKLYDIRGKDIFITEHFKADEMQALSLTAMAVKHLNAIGFYKTQSELHYLFMAVIQETTPSALINL